MRVVGSNSYSGSDLYRVDRQYGEQKPSKGMSISASYDQLTTMPDSKDHDVSSTESAVIEHQANHKLPDHNQPQLHNQFCMAAISYGLL
jgi:hypothetical protein